MIREGGREGGRERQTHLLRTENRQLGTDPGASKMSTYTVPQCQYIRTNGSQCGSPALRNQSLCYYHDRQRPIAKTFPGPAQFPPAPFFLPLLEDFSSIQRGLSKVCEHLLQRRLDPKKAGVLIYAMQLASTNLHCRNKSQKKSTPSAPAS
jgi:hypothetical protein